MGRIPNGGGGKRETCTLPTGVRPAMSQVIRVVVADDNVEFCEIVKQALQSQPDIEWVCAVHDGYRAIEAVKKHRPDLLILDHVMPNLDGIGVLEALRAFPQRPKVLMLTAFGQEALI